MSSTGPLAEALARVEHKLDLLLESQAGQDRQLQLRTLGDPEHLCPLCQQSVTYLVDIMSKLLTRKCGCSTGMQAPLNLQSLAPPTPTETGNGPEE